VWTLLLPIINSVLDRVLPDPAANAAAKLQMQTALLDAQSKGDLAQLDVDKTEASNENMFVAGWRPAIGWCCASALMYQYLLVPLAMWATLWAGLHMPKPPMLDDHLWELMFGMLGMGGLRTVEKISGAK
jgi:hypothetical protein